VRRRALLCTVLLTCGAAACRRDADSADAGAGAGTDQADDGDDDGNDGPLRLRFEEIDVPDDFTLVTKFRFLPGGGELLALHKDGRVGHFRLEDAALERLGEFAVPEAYSDLDCGLLGLALDPDFATNRLIYISTCASQTDSVVLRLTFDPLDLPATVASRVTIIGAGDPAAPRPWHNVGEIGFDATGALWALFGDKRVASNGQAAGNDLSALVRVIPNRDATGSGSTPAPDNPWPDDPDRSPNVYAIGLRSPWTGLVDHLGRFWVGDVGSDAFEEVNLISEPGQNLGWAGVEGPCEGDCGDAVDPVAWWAHEDITAYITDDDDVRATVARVAWVGLEYRPGAAGDPYGGRLTDAVLFGDYCLGFVRALQVDAAGAIVRDEPLGHLAVPSGWDVGPGGFVYASTFGRCETAGIDESDPPPSGLWRAVPADGD
jgi:glucose/arabinose dehydrogenase